MSTPLDPIISEFETQEQADSYDRQQDAQAHRQALAEQRDEYRERLATMEKQLQEAQERA